MNASYIIENRELIEQNEGLRVQVLTVGPGQCVPWHRHTEIADTFFCLQGPMMIETREPKQTVLLMVGQQHRVPANQPHRVSPLDGGRCQFVLVQGVGTYDFLPEED